MAQLADYFISGVWKEDNDNITHVLLHKVNDDNSFMYGVKTTELATINLIKQNNTICTATWGYPDWKLGASVTYVKSGNHEYLRTVANATKKDNLDNSINMKPIKH